MAHKKIVDIAAPTPKLFKAIIIRGDDVPLTEAQAEKIGTDMIAGNSSKVYHLKEQDMYLRVGDCRRVERDYNAETTARRIEREKVAKQQEFFERKQGPKCHGQFSIQREINNIIQSEHPRDWGKFIWDKPLRQKLYDQLSSQSSEWCDYKLGICACPKPEPFALATMSA